ncbi:hypothetical protein MKW92_031281 [Papaver armeniacum]|nr:hypothetical protein MKW92_031281 [Papaver armeniacum]
MPSSAGLIRSFISQGSHREALLLYSKIRPEKTHQLVEVIPLLLKACASLCLLHHGKTLHAESIKNGIDSNVFVGTTLINMYSKCHVIVDSRGYSRNGDMGSASFLFQQMKNRTSVTWSEMVNVFSKNGDTVSARRFFDQTPLEMRSVVTWTVMVDGYVSNGEMEAARTLFEQMPERNFFVWSSMISGYCKKGLMQEAKSIFDKISVRNLVIWNALVGYAQNGFSEEALKAFQRMQDEGFKPDEFSVASALSACAQLGSLDLGKRVHDLINRNRIKLNQFVVNGLVDMYAKCGDISNAKRIFERMSSRNDVCWNAMITGLAVHGRSREALELFSQMEESSENPNSVSFLSVLSDCARGGFTDEGLQIFSKMKEKYGLEAGIEHYGCLVDLLGRAGRVNDAYDLIKTMPVKPNDAVWGALLGACRIHSDTEIAEKVEEIGLLDHNQRADDEAHYVMLSNIYAASDRWENAEKMRVIMAKGGIQKTAGRSSVMLGEHYSSLV